MQKAIITHINQTTQTICSAEETHVYLTNISVIEKQLTGVVVKGFSPLDLLS